MDPFGGQLSNPGERGWWLSLVSSVYPVACYTYSLNVPLIMWNHSILSKTVSHLPHVMSLVSVEILSSGFFSPDASLVPPRPSHSSKQHEPMDSFPGYCSILCLFLFRANCLESFHRTVARVSFLVFSLPMSDSLQLHPILRLSPERSFCGLKVADLPWVTVDQALPVPWNLTCHIPPPKSTLLWKPWGIMEHLQKVSQGVEVMVTST